LEGGQWTPGEFTVFLKTGTLLDREWSDPRDEAFGANLISRSDFYPRKSLSQLGTIFRGSGDEKNPLRPILKGSKRGLSKGEKREGLFCTTNEEEAAFYAGVQAILKGADNSSGNWVYPKGVRPAIYELVNPSDIGRWELWINPQATNMPRSQKPFTGRYDEVILKDLGSPRFRRIRTISNKEMDEIHQYLSTRRPDLLS